jgi:C-terminal processing protease CtpA/Prc
MNIVYFYDISTDRASVDENISLIYEQDDIRVCTMQRSTPEQLLGVYFYCNDRQECLHYIKLIENLQASLARRAGIKNYDRIISLNGVNIENDTSDQFLERFDTQLHLPVQMLVCSPATYAHYKDNNKSINSDLSTVQRLKPIYATSSKKASFKYDC